MLFRSEWISVVIGSFFLVIFMWVYPPAAPVAGGTRSAYLPSKTITPGATNPAITDANVDQTICSKNFRTGSIRDKESSSSQKNKMYAIYGIPHPKNNTGANQMCELDHLISLELGGSDGLANIWPECGPANVPLNQRYFKQKDLVENYLHKLVCAHDMTLSHAQHQIATDWYTVYQYLQSGNIEPFSDDSDPDDAE